MTVGSDESNTIVIDMSDAKIYAVAEPISDSSQSTGSILTKMENDMATAPTMKVELTVEIPTTEISMSKNEEGRSKSIEQDCPKCGEPVGYKDKFCADCGTCFIWKL